MHRRDFIRNACQACAAMALVPIATSLEGCASGAKVFAVESGMLSVPVETLGKRTTAVVSGQGLADKLLIVKHGDGTYTALELHCPHKGGPVTESGDHLE